MHCTSSFLILFNITKKSNLGNLIRTANAFGVSEVIVVGKRSYHSFGAFGTSRQTRQRHFYALKDACQFLRDEDCAICGVEIVAGAVPVQAQPFTGPTAFMVGNEGTGLSEQQMEECDQFIYIPQFGSSASLNVNVATAIVLHHFANWAGFRENDQEGGKFIPSPTSTSQRP